jgi:hypothetical protein
MTSLSRSTQQITVSTFKLSYQAGRNYKAVELLPLLVFFWSQSRLGYVAC